MVPIYMRCLGKTGSNEVGRGDRGRTEQRVGIWRRSVCVWETEEVPLEMDRGNTNAASLWN